MKRIERRWFVAGIFRLVLMTSVVLAFCQILEGRGRAQAILPVAVENLMERNAIRSGHESGGSPSVTSLPSFDNTLAELWRDHFSLYRSEAHSVDDHGLADDPTDEKEKRKAQVRPSDAPGDAQIPQLKEGRWGKSGGFNWDGAFRQSFIFLGIQHAFRLAMEEGTREELKGPFFKDYFRTLRSLRGWSDGDPFLVNYIGHPMMGSVTGFIQVQNDPKGINEELSLKKSYWKSRMKAMGWSFIYSTQFELGMISEASVGNIGMLPNKKSQHPMAYVDLVVTPVVGTGWLVGEDALDKYFIRRVEDRISNRATVILFRSFLNPTRSFANLMRGKWPWYRENRK
jgi:hypothetical protein